MLRIIEFSGVKKRYFIAMLLLHLFYAAVLVLEVRVVGRILDDISDIRYFLYFILLLFLQNILQQIIHWGNLKLNLILEKNFYQSYVKFLSGIPYYHYENADTHQEIYFSKDIVSKFHTFFNSSLSMLVYTIRFVGYLIIISKSVWYLGPIVLLLFVPILWIAFYSGNMEYESQIDSGNFFRRASYFSSLVMGKETAHERRIFGFGKFIKAKWREQQDEAVAIEKKILFFSELYANAGIVLMMVCLLVVFSVIVLLGQNNMTFGSYASLLGALLLFTDEISYSLSQLIRKMMETHLFMKRFARFIDGNYAENQRAEKISDIRKIEFKNVGFSYGENRVLKNCSFILEKGKQYALVGENGAGKTTLIKILLGLLPYEGEVFINDKEMSQIEKESLQRELGVIFQDFNKYELSIADNITLGEEKPLSEILQTVGLDKKVENFSNREHTMLGKLDDGISLSLGEWQKLVLARVLVRENSCLIFDEPTASLDAISEREIIKNINSKLTKDMLSIWITHRLGSCKDSDEILVLKDGEIVERGGFEKLMEQENYFYHLYTTQRSLYYE